MLVAVHVPKKTGLPSLPLLVPHFWRVCMRYSSDYLSLQKALAYIALQAPSETLVETVTAMLDTPICVPGIWLVSYQEIECVYVVWKTISAEQNTPAPS